MNIEARTLTPEQVRINTLEKIKGFKEELKGVQTMEDKIDILELAQQHSWISVTSLAYAGETREAEKLSIGSYHLIGDMYNQIYPLEVRAR